MYGVQLLESATIQQPTPVSEVRSPKEKEPEEAKESPTDNGPSSKRQVRDVLSSLGVTTPTFLLYTRKQMILYRRVKHAWGAVLPLHRNGGEDQWVIYFSNFSPLLIDSDLFPRSSNIVQRMRIGLR